MKRILSISLLIFTIFFFNTLSVKAFSSADYAYRNLCGTYEVAGFHTDGYIDQVECFNDFYQAEEYMRSNGANDLAIMTKVNGVTKVIDANVALLDLSVNPTTLTYFYRNTDLKSAYTYMDTGSLYGGVDGVMLEAAYSSKNVWAAKVKIGNYVGWISQEAYEVVPITWIKSSSSYTVTNDSIRHNYVAKIQNAYSGSAGSTIGPKPEMLNVGTYYSFDGHYFYTDLTTLIKDNRNNTYVNSINKDHPYYNYYMYLSNHTRTSYSSLNIDEYIRSSLGITKDAYGTATKDNSSRLYGKGTFFYYAQEKYGVNAVLSLSLSRNETGNGRSNLAINKNNGFGLNAVDSNPTQAADWYASFASSILGYASKWITYGYAHPRDWRYFGPQFGDKWIGMNVKYASDTYWSEKMASNYYSLDKAKGMQDYNFYQLGVVTQAVNAMSDASNSSKFIYTYPEAEDGVVIVGEKQGESVGGNTTWYKVVSDLNIDSNYNEITSGNYNWNAYVYVPACYVKKINTGKNGYISPNDVTEYQDKYYTYDLYDNNNTLHPKVAVTTKNTEYYYDSTLQVRKGLSLLKDRYVMVYTAAYNQDGRVVAYLVTSDYFYDQKDWISADSIDFVSSDYGKQDILVDSNAWSWVNSTTVQSKDTIISGLYKYTYFPILEKKQVNGVLWYKVPVSLSSSSNIYGWTQASDFDAQIEVFNYTNENNAPVISASDKQVIQGTTYNELDGVSAYDQEDGDITNKVEVISNNVSINEIGEYEITYKVVDSKNKVTTKTIKVTVIENEKPVINSIDIITTVGKQKPDLLKDVTAMDKEDGDITENIEVDDSLVNYDVVGEYLITYTVIDSFQNITQKEVKLTVNENQKPILYATNITITINEEFNPYQGVSAIDEEDGDITDKITITQNNVNTTEIGQYEITYQVSDKNNHMVEKTIMVEVTDKIEKEGSFYFDYLKRVDNHLQLRGYLTISGMNNTLTEDIVYKIILVDTNDNQKKYEQVATRITDLSNINRPIYSSDGFTYTHCWFTSDIDISSVPNGNYIIYIKAEGKTTYSKALVNNKLYKTEETSYTDGNKYVNIKNNYSDRTSAVTLYIRDELDLKTVDSYYNQYDIWRTLEFNDDGLHLKGASYSYGMDLSENADVERTIIFENKNTYQTYKYNIGSITNGLYTVALPVSDNYDKTRAWYDSTIDIRNLPIGEYRIYIMTKSNVVDISEFTDNLGRDLSSKKQTIEEKTYQFSINLSQGNVIELSVY